MRNCASCFTVFSIQGVSEEPLYGVVDNDHEDDEGDVYGRLVDLLPPFKASRFLHFLL